MGVYHGKSYCYYLNRKCYSRIRRTSQITNVDKVYWIDRYGGYLQDRTINVSVDGTDCRVYETRPMDRTLYSHKFHGAGLRYEIAVSIHTGNIVWVNGPYKAGATNDVTIYRHSLKKLLDSGEYVITDNGYPDETCLQSRDCIDANKKKHRRIRAKHEVINGRIKNFQVVSTTFRHDHNLHAYCFHAVVHIIKLCLDENPLFPI